MRTFLCVKVSVCNGNVDVKIILWIKDSLCKSLRMTGLLATHD